MPKTVDYYFSLISPWTYLGGPRFAEITHRHEARVNYKPVNLGKVFEATGGLPLGKRSRERQNYRLMELERWHHYMGMPLNLHPAFFPADEKMAAFTVLATIEAGHDPDALVNAILRAVWAEDRDIADTATLKGILNTLGLDADALLERAGAPEMREQWIANTTEAIERGVFGAPTYIYDDELFWGQDRLEFLDRALHRRQARE